PRRELTAPERPAGTAADGPEPGRLEPGDFFVQVFAGREVEAAELVRKKLVTEGFPAAVFTEREGRSTLYKVRVGGYASRERARETADRLQKKGYSAWVPPGEG
ncbi:MAG TPA: SPOR domain-containing protein, partial [Candidatus Polarisedimenticolaceae bacterium]|nr:SPOR domain-containing protein [Candidatus Polarisedimenticolaceae bacterium]